MNYCSNCAHPLEKKIPSDDNRERHVCPACETIHYENPRLVVGCVPIHGSRVLLCRRDIEPARGLWTLPAGYLELGETAEAGALRETLEETGSTVAGLRPYRFFDLIHIGQMYLMFLATLPVADFHPTEESSEVRLFEQAEIPWPCIAFPVIERTLRHYWQDVADGNFSFRTEPVTGPMKQRGHVCF